MIHRRWVKAAVTLLLSMMPLGVLFSPAGDFRLQFDASTAAISGGNQALDESLILLLRAPERLNAADIDLLTELSLRAKLVPGVRKLQSIALVEIPFGTDDALEIDTLPNRIARRPGQAQQWLDAALNDPLYRGRLVSRDGKATRLIFETQTDNVHSSAALAAELRDLLRDFPGLEQRFQWWLTGGPLVRESMLNLLTDQLSLSLPLVILIFVLVLGIAFRSLVVVLACMASIAISLLWTLAAVVLVGLDLNIVTILIPPLVLTLGVAFCMHVVAAFAEHGQLRKGVQVIRVPVVMSAITTGAGLGGLGFNPVSAIQQFALLGMIGTLCAGLAALLVLPQLLAVKRSPPVLWPALDGPLMRGANWITDSVIRNSRRIIMGGGLLCVFCVIGILKVETGARYIQDLPAEHPVREAVDAISADFGGATGIDISFTGAGRDAILLPEILSAVDELETWLIDQPEIGDAISLPDYVKRIHQAFTDGRPESFRIPQDQNLIKQLLVLGAPDEIYQYTDLNFSRLRIAIVTPLDDTRELHHLLTRIRERLHSLPPGMEGKISGNAVELVDTVEKLTGGQVQAVGFAALSIYIVLTILFASFRVAALAMLPNLLPVFVFFALLGFTGSVLGPSTALVACIVLGIAVDDTLHLLGRFNRLAKEYADEQRACREAVRETIRPITLTTVTISLGFLSLIGSPFHSHVVFGLFAALTLALAWASDLFLATAVSARATIVTLWDRMLLDLGEAPEKTLALFAGMSARQARTFSLVARTRQVPAGENFIHAGDLDQEMFVIIDGEVRIWVTDGEGREVELARLSRGATLGETGHFGRRRSANVAAITPVRLLQFDAGTLERILARHPKVGGLAYRNLNQIQADNYLSAIERFTGATSQDDATATAPA